MLQKTIITRYEEETLKITVNANSNMLLRLIVKDADRENTVYTDRQRQFGGTFVFYVRMPICLNKVDILLFNVDDENNDSGFSMVSVERMPLQKRLDLIDLRNPELRSFIKFAQRFCLNAGWMNANDPNNPDEFYYSDDGQFFIKYLPQIIDMDGNVVNTPARIDEGSGIIEVSQEYFIGYTVPMRFAILTHEFAHVFLSVNPADETEADLNSLLIYLSLGYPRIEAHHAWIDTFERATTEGNLNRYKIMEQFIMDFENNNLVIHGY